MASLVQRVTDLAAAVRDKFNLLTPRVLPSGGTSGQVLAKASGSDYAVEWTDTAGGGASILDGNGPVGTPSTFILDGNG